jgi:asparagine synthetase B (glutamine-hydrolysing)
MNAAVTSRFGYFTVFGFTKNPIFLKHQLRDRLGIVPRVLDFGPSGNFFFYSSYGDIAETEETIVLKLGFVRSLTMSPLSARQLLVQDAVSPEAIEHRAFRGNALVASFSKKEPRFLVYKTILSAPQLYYAALDDGILCATGLRPLVAMMDRVEIREDAIVSQFLFGAVPGPATHFRDVVRLFPGELLKWKDGNLSVELARDLRFADDNLRFEHADSRALDILYDQFRTVIGAYIADVEESGSSFGNLLSGGVDSSFLQLAINEERPGSPARSFSYAVRVPSFEREIEYAKQAVSVFGTEHTFIDVTEEEFPDLLIDATCILGQPLLTMAEVCKLKLADSVSKLADGPQFLFVGQGADTLFGLKISKKLRILECLARVPSSDIVLTLAGALLRPLTRRGQTLLNLADALVHRDDLDYLEAPINTEATIPDFALARRCFGDEAVRRALKDRRDREARYLDSNHYTEKVHAVELLSDCYEIESQSSQLFLSCNKEQLYPFLDEDVVRLSFSFQPWVRYVRGLRHKHVPKRILERRATTPVARQPKGGSMFYSDLNRWMHSGSLHDMVRDISLPGSLSRADFERLVQNPDLSLWHLLAFDVFHKRVLQPNMKHKG